MEYTKYVHQPALKEILKDIRTAILYLAQYHKISDIARSRILLRFLHRNVAEGVSLIFLLVTPIVQHETNIPKLCRLPTHI